jgi:hypothetical protein
LVARLLNKSGLAIAGQTVTFKVVTGGGSVFAGASTSDANGFARERWTLGTAAGLQKVEVRSVDANGQAVVWATFQATATAGAPRTLAIASGNNQSAVQNQALALPAKVLVSDVFGNPVPGVAVAFTASHGGTVAPVSAVTNAAGEAMGTWVLGVTIGPQTLSAAVAGLPAVTLDATATQAPASAPTALAKVAGDQQTGTQHLPLALPFEVRVTDVLNNPVAGAAVTFTDITGGGATVVATAVADSTGSAKWSGTFHTAGHKTLRASVSATVFKDFVADVTASSHDYDGAYACQVSGVISRAYGMFITNGGLSGHAPNAAPPYADPALRGTLDEPSGALIADFNYLGGFTVLKSGQMTLGVAQSAAGSGVCTQYVDFGPHTACTWACSRQ